MSGYQHPHFGARSGGWPGPRPSFLLIVSLILLAGFHALSRRHVPGHPAVPRAPITGRAWVVDGDTIRIGGISIRLEGIDAPERDQSCVDADRRTWMCGRAATRELRDHVRGQVLDCRPRAIDRYGRVVAICALPGGADLNGWLVRQGWAVASGFSRLYASEEADAKAQKRGIWAGTFIYPREWRRQKEQRRWTQ
jgi:endonuclease YncB( thermonuclease family)